MHILVVDDSAVARRQLVRVLGRLGHTCLEAEDGQAALDLLPGAGPLDAVTIDWNMPGMSGRELLDRLRADARYRDLRLVMVTSEADQSSIADALAAGADEYIMKPVTPQVIDEKFQLLDFLRQ